jgi:hypothetical protein
MFKLSSVGIFGLETVLANVFQNLGDFFFNLLVTRINKYLCFHLIIVLTISERAQTIRHVQCLDDNDTFLFVCLLW